jgi:predicted anti-sigma-YlaC factor YlaD
MKPILILGALVLGLTGCSMRQLAADQLGNALAQSGAVYAADDDPELVREAAPFSLKLIESLLAESPRHPGLLLAAARGFTQYAYAFVQQDAEEAEERNLAESRRLEERARRLYRRARDYGLRGLEARGDDVALLYWTAAAWAALIGLSKDSPEALADLPKVDSLIQRALALDDAFDRGAIHALLISYDPQRARQHFARATELSAAAHAAPFVALAEAVCVPQEERAEFVALLKHALDIDPDLEPESRLANLVAQRRARWLLARTERLFTQ